MQMRRAAFFVSLGLAAISLSACTAPTPEPTDTAIHAPAVVTFRVADSEEYSIELTTDELVEHVLELQAGGEDGRIPVGTIVRDGDGGVNQPWSWHIDPESLEFADFTTEVCDGLPSYVEDETLTSDTYCPWSAEVVSVESLDAG